MKLLLISVIVLAICFLAIGIRIWIKGKFADTEVGHNPHMRKLGLRCAKEEEISRWRKEKHGDAKTSMASDCGYCSSCCKGECNL